MPINQRIRELCAKLVNAEGEEYHRIVAELNKAFAELERQKYKKTADDKGDAAKAN